MLTGKQEEGFFEWPEIRFYGGARAKVLHTALWRSQKSDPNPMVRGT